MFSLDRTLRMICPFLCLLLALEFSRPALAQRVEDDEQVVEPADDNIDMTDDTAEPARQAPRGRAGQPTTPADRPLPPAVLAVLETNPQAPGERLRAILILSDLGYSAQARPIVDALLAEPLDAAEKAALVDRFHSPALIRLARNKQLGDALAPWIDGVLASSRAFRRDSARLAESISGLTEADLTVRGRAIQSLVSAGDAAVAPLLQILADPSRADEHATAKRVLLALGDSAVEPLLGALDSPNESIQLIAVEALGRARLPQTLSPLLAPALSPQSSPQLRAAATSALASVAGQVPTPAEAKRFLTAAVKKALDDSRQDQPPASDKAAVWHWNARRNESMPIEYDPVAASLAVAVRLARGLVQIDPGDAASRRLHAIALLQAAKFREGLNKPLPQGEGTAFAIVAREGQADVEDILIAAMAGGYTAATTGAAEILGQIGNEGMLSRGAQPSPMAAAASHADRRLRLAASEAIVRWQTTRPFAGSSQMVEGLGFLAGSFATPRALIVHPRGDDGQTIAGLAATAGYDADVAAGGRAGLQMALANPDYEFVMIHSMIDRQMVDEFLAQLRHDPRTRNIPVGLIATLENQQKVNRLAAETSRTLSFLQPYTEEQMKVQASLLAAEGVRTHPASDERKEQAIRALAALVKLTDGSQRVFDIRRLEPMLTRALYAPDLGSSAIVLLGRMGSPTAQRRLLEPANSPRQTAETRQAAAVAFAGAVDRFGLLLSRPEILRQYDLYNANAGQDADIHAALTTVLDAIERKNDLGRQANAF